MLVATLAGVVVGPAAGADPTAVEIVGATFVPDPVSIHNGTSIEWTNLDPYSHTVDFASFGSGVLDENDTFRLVFDDPGEFDYYCGLHEWMTGTVTVQAVPGAPTAAATATPNPTLRGQPIAFDGSGSTPGTGDIASWRCASRRR